MQAEEDAGGELTDMVSTPQMVLKQLIESQFPTMVAEQAQGDFEGLYAKARPSLRAWMLAPTAASTVQVCMFSLQGPSPTHFVWFIASCSKQPS